MSERDSYDAGTPPDLWSLPAGDNPDPPVAWGAAHPAAAPDRRRVAVFSDAPRPLGDQDRVAPARLGRHACDGHGPAGVHPGDSGRLGGRGGRAAVSAD